MKKTRRSFLKTLGQTSALSFIPAAWLTSGMAWADWPRQWFSSDSYEKTIHMLFADKAITDSRKIHLKLPRVAENGAIVPLRIRCDLPELSKIHVLVEKNPHPLSAQFQLSPVAEPELSLRLKMAESCDVIVIAEDVKGDLYQAKKAVKVTVGGCGG